MNATLQCDLRIEIPYSCVCVTKEYVAQFFNYSGFHAKRALQF